MPDIAAYAGLFTAAFVAATIFPMQSEAILVSLIATGNYPMAALLAVASVGNTLGAAVNWILGRYIGRFSDRRWFPATPEGLTRAEAWHRKYGKWSLLISWLDRKRTRLNSSH